MSKSIVEGSTDKALPLRSKYGRMCGHASKHELHLVTFAAIDRVYEILKPLITEKCPFVNLPGTGRARWGEILDAEKMRPKETGCGIPNSTRSAMIHEKFLRKRNASASGVLVRTRSSRTIVSRFASGLLQGTPDSSERRPLACFVAS
jgi:hypothetical protein